MKAHPFSQIKGPIAAVLVVFPSLGKRRKVRLLPRVENRQRIANALKKKGFRRGGYESGIEASGRAAHRNPEDVRRGGVRPFPLKTEPILEQLAKLVALRQGQIGMIEKIHGFI
ncbi:hypothetical protein [Cohnella nanjingensis]|uniref:hypothetical protein n=1 Tax=Cohnella nanjingensis TaxID=1387779 RepID=UPI001FEBED71|nr:hypothetical protein [Cohnella nanjingensis]